MQLQLSEFEREHAAKIIGWPADAREMVAWAGVDAPFPPTVQLFDAWHADADVHPAVLLGDDQLVGYGEIWVDRVESEVELARIIIAPEQRGKGLGREFVRLLLGRAAAFNMPNVYLRVAAENLAAIRCYEKAGFARVPAAEQAHFNRNQPRLYVWMRCQGGSRT